MAIVERLITMLAENPLVESQVSINQTLTKLMTDRKAGNVAEDVQVPLRDDCRILLWHFGYDKLGSNTVL